MICPKCGFEQPESPECMRCGIIVSRYRGPVAGGASPQPAAPPPPPSFSGNETVRVTFDPPASAAVAGGGVLGAPAPAVAMATAGGTVYEGPPPAVGGGGGTVYGGPPPGAAPPPAPTFGVPRGDVGVGDLLSQTFSIYFANFLPFVLLTAIALAPLFVMQGVMLSVGKASSPSPGLALLSLIPLFLSAVLCPYLATGAITYGVFQQLRQKDTSVADCLSQGLSALPRILGVAIVQGFLVFLGTLACVVPGIILSIRWAVSVPTSVTERTGASESMSRSTFLTEGFRWEVFGLLFVIGILNFGLAMLVYLATAKNPSLNALLSGVASVFTTGVAATGSAVLYYRLRSVKESIDVDQIASVFA